MAASLVNDFLRSLGMHLDEWKGEGSMELELADRGRIVFETAKEVLLVYLISPLTPLQDPRLSERALRLSGNDSPIPFPVHCALSPEGALVFAIRLDPDRQSLLDLERAIECLLASEHQFL